jgi:hypothetical protein
LIRLDPRLFKKIGGSPDGELALYAVEESG